MTGRTMTIMEVFRPNTKVAGAVYDIFIVFAASTLIALSAQISFWIGPVPITGQTFAVLILAALLGSVRALSAVLLYLAQGAAGLPVFAGGASTVAWMIGPTGGYLFGFLVAAAIVGFLAKAGWDRKFWTVILAMTIGNLCIHIFGIAWLMILFSIGKMSGSLQTILTKGALIFVPGDILKIILAALILPAGWKLISRFES